MPTRLVLIAICAGLVLGCGSPESTSTKSPSENAEVSQAEKDFSSDRDSERPAASPLPPAPEPEKVIYAKSFINKPAPEFIVAEWLSPKIPDREGKMVLIDFWATWCGPCLEAIPKLNQFHRKYKDQLVVIGVSDESSNEVRAHRGAPMNYAIAIDPQRRMYDELGITNIPHLVIIDPSGIVRWQGYPMQKGHELTEEVIENLLETYVR